MSESLPELQSYVWDLLPQRKHEVGKEVVYDIVSAAVQEWPDENYSSSKSGDSEELRATAELSKSMKRHMQVIYGDKQFGSLWIVALQILIPVIIDLMLRWWRRKERHRKLLRLWRRNWTNG